MVYLVNFIVDEMDLDPPGVGGDRPVLGQLPGLQPGPPPSRPPVFLPEGGINPLFLDWVLGATDPRGSSSPKRE